MTKRAESFRTPLLPLLLPARLGAGNDLILTLHGNIYRVDDRGIRVEPASIGALQAAAVYEVFAAINGIDETIDAAAVDVVGVAGEGVLIRTAVQLAHPAPPSMVSGPEPPDSVSSSRPPVNVPERRRASKGIIRLVVRVGGRAA